MKVKSLSRVQLLATLWTAAYQAPPPMGFSRQEYWNGVPLPSPTPVLGETDTVFHALEKEMATHSSVPAWRIPGTGSLVGCRLWGHTELDMTEAT